jgi:hypothetical protein
MIRRLAGGLVGLVDGLNALAGLTVISVVCGVLMLWVLGKTTPQRRLERARDRMVSAVYEVRLFLDSPGRVWRAQARLVLASFVYLAYLLPAFVILLPPLALLYPPLDARYGIAPLPPGEPALVKVELAGATTPATVAPLFVEDERTLYLRVVVDEPGQPVLGLRVGDAEVGKRLSADPARPVSVERASGLLDLLAFGDEAALAAEDGVSRISVGHAAAARTWLGLAVPWWVYWLIVSMATALALRRPMGIVF